MASPSARASTAVNWSIQPVSLNAISFPVARLLVQLYFGTERPGPQSAQESCWLDTGAPLSVVPFNRRAGQARFVIWDASISGSQ
jgi:hypothetical protein